MHSASWDRVVPFAGGFVAMLGAMVGTIAASLLTPLHIAGVRAPICVALIVMVNVVAIRFAYATTGSRLATIGPVLGWFVVTVWMAWPRKEGDFFLTDDWVSAAMMLFGAASATAAVMTLPIHSTED